MPNRFYTQDPRISGPLDFLAGLGLQRQQVHAQEAVAQQRQDIADSQTLQRGFGQLTDVFENRTDRASALERQLLAGQQDVYLENLDNLNRIRAASPPGISPQQPTQLQEGFQSPPPGQAGPPLRSPESPPPGQAGPPPPEPLLPAPMIRPEMASTYKQDMQRLRLYAAEGLEARTNPYISPEHKQQQLAAITKKMQATQQRLARMKRPDNSPKMPDGTPMRPGINKAADGTVGVLDAKGVRYYAPTMASESIYAKLKTPEERQAYQRSMFVGDYDAFIERGGYGEVDEKGGVTFKEPKDKKSEFDAYMAPFFKPDPLTGTFAGQDPKVIQDAITAYRSLEAAEGAIDDLETLKGRIGDGTLTIPEAQDLTGRMMQMYGVRGDGDRDKIPLADQKALNAIFADALKNTPPEARPPVPFPAPPPTPEPTPEPASPKVQRLRQFRQELEQRPQKQAMQQEAERIAAQEAKRERELVGDELTAIQNIQAGPNDDVLVVRPDGQTIVLKKNKLTAKEMAKLKKAGFRIPGLDE